MNTTIDQTFTDILHTQMPLSRSLGFKGTEVTPDKVIIVGEWQAEHCGIREVLHGGYLMAMADAAGATLAFVNLSNGATTTTVESKTNFFRPVTQGDVVATATPVHRGKSTIVVQTDITNGDGALVSRTLQTQIVQSR